MDFYFSAQLTVEQLLRQASDWWIDSWYETCEQGITVNIGRYQCKQNCRARLINPTTKTIENQKCVGLVEKTCSILAQDCIKNASCVLSNKGFVEHDLICVQLGDGIDYD